MSGVQVKTRDRKKNNSKTPAHPAKTGDGGLTGNTGHARQSPQATLSAFYAAGPVFNLPVQRKVVIGRVNDPYEREADGAADRVNAGLSVPFISRITPGGLGAPVQRKEEEKEEEPVQELALQRKEEEEKKEDPVQELALQRKEEEEKKEEPVQELALQRKEEEEKKEEPVQELALQRKEEEEKKEEPVQSKAVSSGPSAPSVMHSAAAGAIRGRGPGEPMKPSTRHTLESRMGVDLSDVRVHSDSSAQESAGALKAKAFTHKQHIWLGRGQSQDDVHLMTHETSHVLQQDGVVRKKPIIQRAPEDEAITDGPVKDETLKDEEEKSKEEEKPAALKPPEPSPAAPKIEPEKKPAAAPPTGEGKTTPKALPVPVQKPIIAEGKAPGKEKENETTPAGPEAKKEETKKEEIPAAEQAPGASVEAAAPAAEGGPVGGGAVEGAAPAPAEKAAEGGEGGEKAPKEAGKKEEEPKEGKAKGKGEGKEEKTAAETPSPENDPRFQGVMKRLDKNAEQEKTHEPAEKKVGDAQSAAVPPENDRSSRAQAAQVEVMDQQEAKKPETDSFLTMLRAEIERIAPKDMDAAEKFKKEGKAAELKNKLTSDVDKQKEDASGDIKTAAETEPDPNSVEPKQVVQMPPDPANPKQVELGSKDVLPVPKTEEEISVEENTQKADDLMAENDIDEEQLQNANEPQFDDALKSKKELDEHAAQVPDAYKGEEKAVLKESEADVEAREKDAKDQMRSEREKAKGDVKGKQDETKKKEEEERKKVADDIQGMYDETKKKVDDKLNSLDEEVNGLFDEGEKKARANFESYVDDRMSKYKWDRYLSKPWGLALWVKDKFFDLPDEVNKFYEEGRDLYLKEMDTVLVAIADRVETVLKEAKDEIAGGKAKIAEYVEALPKNLKKAGQEAQDNLSAKFDELQQGVDDKKKQLAQQLAQKYKDARDKLDARIEELKAANKGLVDAFIGKILEIIKMLKEFKERVMGLLGQAADSVRKIVKNPIGFLKNILGAVKQGFGQFVDNILTHLKKGLMEWLFGALAGTGIEIPSDLNVKAIFGLVMQILGITRDRIRTKMVKFIGEKNVGRIEKAWEVVSTLISEGPAGLWEKAKEYMGNLKEMVMGAIQDWLIDQVIKQAVLWVVSLFNPVSALLKAIKLIYDVIMFFVENIERIIKLVEAVVQSVAKIVAGQVAEAANWIENAMGKTVPIIISFLARLLSLGGISEKIMSIIQNIQKKVDDAVDKVIKKIVGKIKSVFGKGKKAIKKGIEKVKDILFPSHTFKAGADSHKIWIDSKAAEPQVMISSKTEAITAFISTLEKRDDIDDTKKNQIPTAKGKIQDMNNIIKKMKSEKDNTKSKEELLKKEKEFATILKSILSGTKTSRDLYKLEGMVATYGTMPRVTGDKLTPDHQPQKSAVIAVGNLPEFKGTKAEAMAKDTNVNEGMAINVFHKRHVEGRTYGGKGSSTLSDFKGKLSDELPKLSTKEAKKDKAIKLLKKELSDDVVEMKEVYNKTNAEHYSDIKDDPELVKEVKQQGKAGEDRIKSQDLDKLKN